VPGVVVVHKTNLYPLVRSPRSSLRVAGLSILFYELSTGESDDKELKVLNCGF
jgi:hypothetical protein